MFNTEDYRARLDAKMLEVDSGPGDWRLTIDVRAGQFMLMQIAAQLNKYATALRERYADTPDKKMFRAHYAACTLNQGMAIGLAGALIAGTATLPNPLEFEAMMRLNAINHRAAND